MSDSSFTGNIPDLYHQHLVPLLFEPWAALVADRIAALHPASVVEMAAGTGVVTAELAKRLPESHIVATDLNPAMLDVARRELGAANVEWVAADATALPFEDGRFDAAASQFGIMFYPDRVKGYTEAARVLRPGGTLVAAVWGSLDDNPVTKAVHAAMEAAFPADPPRFLARTPFGYFDAQTIINEAEAAGFDLVSVEQISLPHPSLAPGAAVDGLILGSPLRAEVEERGPGALDKALSAARSAVAAQCDEAGRISAEMTALIITAST